jgi:hypothetical protein
MHTPSSSSPPQSNNPFRASMLADSSSSPQNLPSPTPPPPLYKTPSTTTTLAEPARGSEDLADAQTETGTVSTASLPMQPICKDKEVIITVHDTTPASVQQQQQPASVAVKTARNSTDRRSMRCSMQVDESGMWPARRLLQKEEADRKRLWMWGKILIGVLIIGVAVAVGLGISKAVSK